MELSKSYYFKDNYFECNPFLERVSKIFPKSCMGTWIFMDVLKMNVRIQTTAYLHNHESLKVMKMALAHPHFSVTEIKLRLNVGSQKYYKSNSY